MVRPSRDFRKMTSAPMVCWASATCPSVGKSSSERMIFRRFEKSTQLMMVDKASDTFTVMASSAGSAPTRAPNVSFNRRIWGKMCSLHKGSGAPSDAQASMYSSRYRRARFDTGPSEALIRYALRFVTGNSSRYDSSGLPMLLEVVEVHGAERVRQFALARALPIVQQREQVAHADVGFGPVQVPRGGFGGGDGLDQAPQEDDVQPVFRQSHSLVVEVIRGELFQFLAGGHGPSLLCGAHLPLHLAGPVEWPAW